MTRRWLRHVLAGLALVSAVAAAHAQAPHRDMIAAANPLAAEAGREILRRGGSAVDAAIAAQLVLNLVEPESSGIGGGAIMVLWSPSENRLTSFDGRETAPMAAKPDRFLDAQGAPLNYFDALVGGRSVGVPGLLRMLDLAHRRYGKLPWASLFEPAIGLAENGYPMSPKLHDELARDRIFSRMGTPDLFFAADGSVKPVGTMLTNPELAVTFKTIAADGADAFYRGAIAADIVAAVDHAAVNPGDMTIADIAAYAAKERAPVCGAFRAYLLCGMGPPSSGGVTLIEMLGLMQHFDLYRQVNTAGAWNVFAQASRLAYADRDRYVADPDFGAAPVGGLLDRRYLTQRSKLIDPAHFAPGAVAAGEPPRLHAANWGRDATPEFPSTSNLAVIDRDGNALDMTTTIEFAFGSHLMVHGFLLNNELTDFSFVPEADGKPVANRIEGGKRPRSSMAPTLVFDAYRKLIMSVGSAGGAAIITDVAKTLVATLDWHFGLQRAMDLPNIGNRNDGTEVEATHDADALAEALAAMGHEVRRSGRLSGLSGIRVTPHGFEGAADKRRAGIALGD